MNQPLTSSRPTRSRVGAWGLIPFTLFLLGCEPRKTSLPHSDSGPETGSSPNTLSPQEVRQGWILLWDGETTFGWEALGEAEWQTGNGILSAASGNSGWLATNGQFADYLLKLEYRTAADGNSGVFLRSLKEGEPHETGYELQICDSHPSYTTGSLVNHLKAKPVATDPDRWQSYEISVQGDHFVVRLNGEQILDARSEAHRTGHIGLQYNQGKSIEFRNIKLKPLGLEPIFDGKSLQGWRKVDRPDKPMPHQWSVREGRIHVEKGAGQLETERTFKDFVFQLDIRTNAPDADTHPNSGVFFRGDPGGFWTGYESQIRNQFEKGDRTKPVDFGTGGLYFYHPARRVVPSDGEFFTKTITAKGRHIAVWVNGYPVTDFVDRRAEGDNARREARLQGGTFSLQAHDPTTNLDFRNLRAVELPER